MLASSAMSSNIRLNTAARVEILLRIFLKIFSEACLSDL